MKNDRFNIRTTEDFKIEFQKLKNTKGLSESELLEYLFYFYKENQEKDFLAEANKIPDFLFDKIQYFEAVRDYERDLNNDEILYLESIYLCYDLLVKNPLILNDPENTVPLPPEMRDEGDSNTTYRHACSADETAEKIIESILQKINKNYKE